MNRRLRNMFLTIIVAGLCLILAVCAILYQPKFGKFAEGERLERVQASPNYVDGEFRNTVPTPSLAEGQSFLKIVWNDLFTDKVRLRPLEPLPTLKTDLTSLDAKKDIVIWLGHSSYFIQLGGKKILIDPVFSDYGAPFSFLNRIFLGTDVYTVTDMPEIDYLLISHDHWDHLDYATVTGLMHKVKTVVSPVGLGAHIEHWGYPPEKLREADWNTALRFENGFTIHVVPARHYSGRLFAKNKALWAGFVLESASKRLFLSGDTGYGPHFGEIARAFGGFDIVALDGGQYDSRWPLIHMTPEEAAKAAEELGAKALLLGHVGRFSIASHPWDEPFIRVAKASEKKPFRLLTPKIGEPVFLDATEQSFTRWWEAVR